MNTVHSLLTGFQEAFLSRKVDPRKREAILRSARELFKQNGVEKTTMRKIAGKAGIATGTVYLYFNSKAKIIDALCDYYLLSHIEALKPSLEIPDVRQNIASTTHAALQHASENADLVRLIDMRRSIDGRVNRPEANRVVLKTVRDAFARGIEAGVTVPYNPAIMAELVSGMLEWICKICFVWSDVDPKRYESTWVELLSRALIYNNREGVK